MDTEHPANRRFPGVHRGVDMASSPDYVALRTADGRIATVPSWAAAVLREQGVAEERARSVRWLRRMAAEHHDRLHAGVLAGVADLIASMGMV